MSMSRKDYCAIAEVISAEVAVTANLPREQLRIRLMTLSLADVMYRNNNRFNRGRFYEACGLTSDGLDVK